MKLQTTCIELASAKSAALGRTLPLLVDLSNHCVKAPPGHPFAEGLTVCFLG